MAWSYCQRLSMWLLSPGLRLGQSLTIHEMHRNIYLSRKISSLQVWQSQGRVRPIIRVAKYIETVPGFRDFSFGIRTLWHSR